MWALADAITFQFTTSQGGRLHISCNLRISWNLSIHDLTRRSTRSADRLRLSCRPFNSRPHKEVDKSQLFSAKVRLAFQFTTSQGGRRFDMYNAHFNQNLSIHDLTRRSTLSFPQNPLAAISFNSRPHKEVDHIQDL